MIEWLIMLSQVKDHGTKLPDEHQEVEQKVELCL